MDPDCTRKVSLQLATLEARYQEKIDAMEREIKSLHAMDCRLDKSQREIFALLNRWRGAWPVITVVGGLLAFGITQLDKLDKLF